MKKQIADALKNTPASYYIKSAYFFALKIKNAFKYCMSYKKIAKQLDDILDKSDYDICDIFYFRFGWSAGSFQRAQHIAYELSKNKTLVFYAKNPVREKTQENFKKLYDNLYLIDIDNPVLMKALRKKLTGKKIIHTCSTNIFFTKRVLKKYTKKGFGLLYEYIDEISPELSGSIPKSFLKLHTDIAKNTEYTVVSSAKELYRKIALLRGDENHVLAQNAVNYEHWQVPCNSYKKHTDIAQLKDSGKKIIGYFGALAKWFDYELLKKCALRYSDAIFVLIGWQYDDSFAKSGISELENVKFLGSKDYSVLPEYITAFDVATIPFLINDITLSTSPVKLYEYLAAGKPCVCTAMPECIGVDGVLCANDEQYIENLAKALEQNDVEACKKSAMQNTWGARVLQIINTISK